MYWNHFNFFIKTKVHQSKDIGFVMVFYSNFLTSYYNIFFPNFIKLINNRSQQVELICLYCDELLGEEIRKS